MKKLRPAQWVKANGRIEYRLEIFSPQADRLGELSRTLKLPKYVILTRLLEWLFEQPPVIQNLALKMYPDSIAAEIAAFLLGAPEKKKPKR